MSNPKISIGMPIYNGASYIDQAINSVLNQTFKDFELIISDNASTDNTENICKKYLSLDNRIHYLRQKKNIGGINNFKFVLDSSVGKYFMWLAADDALGNANFLKLLNDKISEKYDFYFPEVSIINYKNEVMKSNTMQSFNRLNTKIDFLKVSLDQNSQQLYSLFTKSKLIEDWKYLETCKNLKHCNEGLFVHVINATRNGYFVKDALKFYRYHKSNWVSKVNGKNLILSQMIYALKSIKLILGLNELLFFKKIQFPIKIFFTSFKAIVYFALNRLWHKLGFEKFRLLKKIINKLRT